MWIMTNGTAQSKDETFMAVCVTEYVWNLLVCVNLLCKSQVNIHIYICRYICMWVWRYEGVCVYLHTYICVCGIKKPAIKSGLRSFFDSAQEEGFRGGWTTNTIQVNLYTFTHTYVCMPKMHNIVVSMHVCMCE